MDTFRYFNQILEFFCFVFLLKIPLWGSWFIRDGRTRSFVYLNWSWWNATLLTSSCGRNKRFFFFFSFFFFAFIQIIFSCVGVGEEEVDESVDSIEWNNQMRRWVITKCSEIQFNQSSIFGFFFSKFNIYEIKFLFQIWIKCNCMIGKFLFIINFKEKVKLWGNEGMSHRQMQRNSIFGVFAKFNKFEIKFLFQIWIKCNRVIGKISFTIDFKQKVKLWGDESELIVIEWLDKSSILQLISKKKLIYVFEEMKKGSNWFGEGSHWCLVKKKDD